MSQFTWTTIDSVLKDISLCHVETLSRDVHARKFLPLVEMLKAKHFSLWYSLSFSKQEKLLTLLEQMKPGEQDCLLRVVHVMNNGRMSLDLLLEYFMPTDNVDRLLSLLICLHSTDRSNLLRLLEPMDQQEQRKLIRVMGDLKESEQVEVFGILDDLEALEQKMLLNVMPNFTYYNELETMLKLMKSLLHVDRSRLLRVLDGLDSTSQRTLLRVLEHSSQCHELINRSNLLRLLESMDRQEREELIKVMDRLEESEQVELLEILDELQVHQRQILLKVLNTRYPAVHYNYETVAVDRSRLLRILFGLDSVQQHLLLKVLEQSTRQHELIEVMDRLKPQEQLQLLRVMLGRVDSPVKLSITIDEILSSPVRMSEMIDQHQQQQQLKRVLKELGCLQQKYNLAVHSMDDARLLSKAANLVYLHLPQRDGRLSLDRSSLQQCLEKLEPLERKQLPRVLSRLNVSGLLQQVEILYKEELKGVDVRSMLSDAYELLMQMEYESQLQRLLQLFVCLLSIYLSETGSQGGFRNLLLDGWWLEFWEIILLAAGDVERNPGPTFMTEKELAAVSNAIIEEDDLSDIFDNALPISSKWSRFCSILGLRPSLLDTISKNHHGDCEQCLFEGVKYWLQGNYNTEKHGPPTWRKLVAAVDNSAGGSNHALAKEIAEKHSDKGTSAQTIQKPAGDDNDRDREESREGHQHSAAFSKMYGAITRSIGRSLAPDDLRQFLRFFSNPHSPSQRYIKPSVYMGVESTRDILDQLYPAYVNPGNIYLLEEIVKLSNSRQCKRLLKEYTNKYH